MENLNDIEKKYKENFNTEIKDNVLLISEKLQKDSWYMIKDKYSFSIGRLKVISSVLYEFVDIYEFNYDNILKNTWDSRFIDFDKKNIISELTTEELFKYFKKITIAKNFVEGFEFKTVEGNWQECNDYFDRIKYNDGCIDFFCNNHLIYRRGVWAEVRKTENKEMVFYSFIQDSEIFVALKKCKKESGFIHVFVFNKQTKEYLRFYVGTPFCHNYKELSLNDLLEYFKEVAKVKYANENLNFDCFWLDSNDKDFRLKYNEITVYENDEWASSILGSKNKEFNETEHLNKEIDRIESQKTEIRKIIRNKTITKKQRLNAIIDILNEDNNY